MPGILYSIYTPASLNKPIFGKATVQKKLQKKKKAALQKFKMQGVPSLVQQGTWMCAQFQACEQFYQLNTTIQLPKLRCTFRQQLNQTAKRAANPSPTQAKLSVAGTAASPVCWTPKRGRFCSRRRMSRRGEELNNVLQPLLDPCLTWCTGSLGCCQLAPAHPDPARRVGGLQESFESKLRKIFANPVQQHSSTISTPANTVRKTLCKEVLHCIYLFCCFACRFLCAGVISLTVTAPIPLKWHFLAPTQPGVDCLQFPALKGCRVALDSNYWDTHCTLPFSCTQLYLPLSQLQMLPPHHSLEQSLPVVPCNISLGVLSWQFGFVLNGKMRVSIKTASHPPPPAGCRDCATCLVGWHVVRKIKFPLPNYIKY